MRWRNIGFKTILMGIGITVLVPSIVVAETDLPVMGWPRLYHSNGNKVTVYQPQLDAWKDYRRPLVRCLRAARRLRQIAR